MSPPQSSHRNHSSEYAFFDFLTLTGTDYTHQPSRNIYSSRSNKKEPEIEFKENSLEVMNWKNMYADYTDAAPYSTYRSIMMKYEFKVASADYRHLVLKSPFCGDTHMLFSEDFKTFTLSHHRETRSYSGEYIASRSKRDSYCY